MPHAPDRVPIPPQVSTFTVPPRAISFILAVLFLTDGALAQADPETPGPFKVTVTTQTTKLPSAQVTFDLYIPAVTAPSPVLAFGHGFTRNKGTYAALCQRLASQGYVIGIPNFPGVDHALNGKVLAELLEYMVKQGGTAGSPLVGVVDGTRRGVLGHSAGGLSAFLAAATDPAIDIVIGLDPVDANQLGEKAAPALKVPTVVLRSQPSGCNSNGNAAAMYAALTSPKLTLMIVGGTHCDPEPAASLCSVLCGAWDVNRHARYARYAAAALGYILRCDNTMAPYLGGAAAQADTLIEKLDQVGFPPAQAVCGASGDGIVVKPDANVAKPDAPFVRDSGPAADRKSTTIDRPRASDVARDTSHPSQTDSATANGGDSAPKSGSSSGCEVAPTSAPASAQRCGAVAIFGLFALLVLRRRSAR